MATQYLDPSNYGTLDLATANKLYTQGQDSRGRGGMNYLTDLTGKGDLASYLDYAGYNGDRSWYDPNASYYVGGLKSVPESSGLDPNKYHNSNVVYKVDANGQLVPVSAYGIESKGGGFGADLVGGLAKYGTMAALAWSGGQALGAIAGGLTPAAEAGTTAATTAGQIGGSGLTSAQAAALYGDVGYGAGMTGAETAAYDAAIAEGMTAGEAFNKVKQGYDYYNKGKKALGLIDAVTGGGGQQGAPTSQPAPGGFSGGTGDTSMLSGSHRGLLGNPQLGNFQRQQADFLKRSYAPVAQEAQRRRLKGLLSEDYT